MMFEDWMTKMRAARKVPFGTAYELFAREAWNAAVASEREECATWYAEKGWLLDEDDVADAMRKRDAL